MKAFRVEKVGSEVRQIISNVISHKLNDPRISSFTTVTRVKVSRDLEHARVFVSVYGREEEQERTLSALKHATGFIQRSLAESLPTRQCPRVTFFIDESIKRGREVLELIQESMEELDTEQEERESGGGDTGEGADT